MIPNPNKIQKSKNEKEFKDKQHSYHMEQSRERFLSAYADIPNVLRKEIIAVVDGKTYTWDSTYFEVNDSTKLSEKLLNTLLLTKII